MEKVGTVSTLIGMIALLVGTAVAQEGAKAIFYSGAGPTVIAKPPSPAGVPRSPGSPPSLVQEEYMGLKYWVELVPRDGEKKRVATDHVFRSGDRIKLRVQSNRDGYLYLVNVGSTGRSHMLFPYPGMRAGSNSVKANLDYEVPYASYIRFDENPGEEVLLIMLSPMPMGESAPVADPRTASVSPEDAARLMMNAQVKGAKDLILEVDTTSAHPAGYAVAPVAALKDGGMITLQVKLRHR